MNSEKLFLVLFLHLHFFVSILCTSLASASACSSRAFSWISNWLLSTFFAEKYLSKSSMFSSSAFSFFSFELSASRHLTFLYTIKQNLNYESNFVNAFLFKTCLLNVCILMFVHCKHEMVCISCLMFVCTSALHTWLWFDCGRRYASAQIQTHNTHHNPHLEKQNLKFTIIQIQKQNL